LEEAPQEEFHGMVRGLAKTYLTKPMDKWNIEETDIVLSFLAGGSFSRIMVGSLAVYKET